MISLYDFLTETFMNTRIYEMAINRGKYEQLCEDLYQQILENIACILYAQENEVSQENIRHWLTELSSYVHRLRKTGVKSLSKKRIIKDVLDTMHADDRRFIRDDLDKKFKKEKFEMSQFSYDAQGELIRFLNVDLVEIICEPYDDSDSDVKHDTFQRLADALNINI